MDGQIETERLGQVEDAGIAQGLLSADHDPDIAIAMGIEAVQAARKQQDLPEGTRWLGMRLRETNSCKRKMLGDESGPIRWMPPPRPASGAGDARQTPISTSLSTGIVSIASWTRQAG